VTDFVLESATANAERVLADRRWFVLSDEAWSEFQAPLDAPLTRTPKLSVLLREPTIFDPQDETAERDWSALDRACTAREESPNRGHARRLISGTELQPRTNRRKS
jgi:Protein of unknown function (DUF1778)